MKKTYTAPYIIEMNSELASVIPYSNSWCYAGQSK